MKVLLVSVGTRGDMEPFLAIGNLLMARGHTVAAAFPAQFESLASSAQIPFHSLGPEFLQLLESEDGKLVMGGKNGLKKLLATLRLAKRGNVAQDRLVQNQIAAVNAFKPDLIVHHSKAVFPLIWEVSNPDQTVMISPVPYLHYVPGHSHLAFRKNFGAFFNQLTYKIADWGLLQFTNRALKKLKIEGIGRKDLRKVLREHKVIYTISPQLFEGSDYWSEKIKILGYHERDKTSNWSPSEDLQGFIEAHKKILFVTFGSMGNLDPVGNTKILLDLVTQHQIPTIFNTAGGGLTIPEDYDTSLIHFVPGIPYDWIFPKIYAVIHHGGSGTTHTALKYGCASMIIPHIIDQFIWNEIVADKKCGPLGIPVARLSKSAIELKLLALWQDSAYRANAEKTGKAMQMEHLEEQLIEELLHQKARAADA